MYHHEKSATRSFEITVRSDSIRDTMILIVKNVPSSALSSKAPNRKQIGTKYLQQPVGNGVCFFFFHAWSHWFVWLKLLSGYSDVVTAHTEGLRTPVQKATHAWFFFVRSSFNCFFDTRKIKNCKQTWKSRNAWRRLFTQYRACLAFLLDISVSVK